MTEETGVGPERPRPVSARPVVLRGASRPVEGASHGQPSQSDLVVIALHGGPLDAWRMSFDPLLHTLAANGLAVLRLAPNQRAAPITGWRTPWPTASAGVAQTSTMCWP